MCLHLHRGVFRLCAICINCSLAYAGYVQLYLSLGQVQCDCDLVSAKSGQVVVSDEILLQLADLLLRERRSFFAQLGCSAGNVWWRLGRVRQLILLLMARVRWWRNRRPVVARQRVDIITPLLSHLYKTIIIHDAHTQPKATITGEL